MNQAQSKHRQEKLEQIRKHTLLAIAANLVLACIKVFTGLLGNSYALIADGIESTVDIFSSVLVLFGIHYAAKPPDQNHPYGHGRIEPLITFMVVGLLLGGAGLIAWQSLHNIYTPHSMPEPYTAAVLVLVIFVKEMLYRSQRKKAKETGSTAIEADAWHHRSDAITSFTALLGIAIALFLGPGYESADDWAALLAALLIAINAVRLSRPAFGDLMDEHQYDALVNQIKEFSTQIEGILDTEKCRIRKSGLHFYVDLHVEVAASLSVAEGHSLAHKLKDRILEEMPFIADVLIHVEPHEA